MLASLLSSVCAAKRPMATISLGSISSIWRIRCGAHLRTSSGSGLRLPGGRHFRTLAIYTFSPRFRPIAASILSSSRPACPTKGSPSRSSSAPGASPISSQSACSSPTPSTVCLRVLCRPHAVQAGTACFSSIQRSCGFFSLLLKRQTGARPISASTASRRLIAGTASARAHLRVPTAQDSSRA